MQLRQNRGKAISADIQLDFEDHPVAHAFSHQEQNAQLGPTNPVIMTEVHDDEIDSADGKCPAVITDPSRATVGLLPPPLESSGGTVPLAFLSTQEHHDDPLAEHHLDPPSSVNGEVDEEDNWSRHVETEPRDRDHHLSSDMLLRHQQQAGGHNEITDDDDDHHHIHSSNRLPEPEKPELTLKEKLVLRERQRRIETERARLKRQFAQTAEETSEEFLDEVIGAAHSVGEGTLGKESMRAHPDEESADANRLGFNMERFLRNSDSFNPQLEPMTEAADGEDTATTGVVMERFLNDPIVVPDQGDMETVPSRLGDEGLEESNQGLPDSLVDEDGTRQTQLVEPHRSVSFDVDGLASGHLTNDPMDLANASVLSIAESISQPGEHASSAVSLEVQRDVASSHEDAMSTTTSADEQPRMLRLTEADMLEMASIDDASIGNAPPSDRDDEESLSEIGELAGFGGGHHPHHHLGLGGDAALSHDTPTTAMESASQISGYHSQRSTHLATSAAVSAVSSSSAERRLSEHNGFIEGIQPSATDPSHHLLMSPGAGSVVVHPPSESGRDDYIDDADVLMQNSGVDISHISRDRPDLLLHDPSIQSSLLLVENVARVPEMSDGILDAPANRQRRYNPPGGHDSPPDSGRSPRREDVVDDFDFDKNMPSSPDLAHHDSFHELPVDQWSPQGKMNISPLHAGPRRVVPNSVLPVIPSMSYGAIDGDDDSTDLRPRGLAALSSDPRQGEQAPLLGVRDDIPPEIITRRTHSDPELGVNGQHIREHSHRNGSVASIVEAIVEDVFHDVRSIDEEGMEKIVSESDAYLASNIWARGTCTFIDGNIVVEMQVA